MERTLYIESRVESLHEIERLVDDVSAEFTFSSEVYGNVLIAALEAANNAIVHGNKLDPDKKVFVSVFQEGKELHWVVKDQGEGFDFTSIPDPTAPENIENISGRGIFLMEKLSDKIRFEENGTRVEMVFNMK
jgi:serine/threonine-protein kinase RsbW